MAVLKALEAICVVDIFCDNSGVVRRLSSILQHGFDYVNWRSHPNVDLWARIAAQVITRPNGNIAVTKVKSPQSLPDNAPVVEKRRAKENDFADHAAKKAVADYLQAKVPNYREWKKDEEETISHAIKTSALLHDISLLFF